MTESRVSPLRQRAEQIAPGQVFEAVYPFVRDTYEAFDADEEGFGTTTVPTWKPGTRNESAGEDVDCVADALGKMVLTVVSVHHPKPFPARVFFLRSWIDPDGKAFGKRKLRMTTLGAFTTLRRGYRHQFILAGCSCKGCDWPYNDHREGDALEAMDREAAEAV